MVYSNRFAGAVAIVTGGASGIGRALSEMLAARGALVTVADLDGDGAVRVAEAITRAGGTVDSAAVDVTHSAAVDGLVANTVAKWGRLDFMFNNAGIAVVGRADELESRHWERVIDVNLRGVVNGVTAAYRVMREQGSGHILNTSSMAGLIPFPLVVPYTAAKHAVVGLSLGLRPEAARFGVRVSVVCPGFVESNIYDVAELVGTDRKVLLSRIPVTPVPARRAAAIILRGAERNRSVIIFPFLARVVWWAYRLHPNLVAPIARQMIRSLEVRD